MRTRYLVGGTGLILAGSLAIAIPAMADTTPPTPSYSYTTATPTYTPTPTATPTPTPTPVVNPFAGCVFSTTHDYTFDRLLGRFVVRTLPAIVCDRWGVVSVYDLVP